MHCNHDPCFHISIHAPTGGATSGIHNAMPIEIFQSTLPQGERLSVFPRGSLASLFQSTLPQGERQVSQWSFCASVIFQSTLPQGERLIQWAKRHMTKRFQSTLPQGERPPSMLHQTHFLYNFNPRSHRGSDAVRLS